MPERTTGRVKWFSRVKGYGFITPDDDPTAKDVFVHYSSIRGEGFRNLREGELVEYTLEDSPKGPQASDVVSLGQGEDEEDAYSGSGPSS
ncbi:MAG TPA: cold shock domain-containing protein [Chloroflexi bacterium]|nr:cold shock domain-containing protein [Chloroflexota bacterium]